MADLEDVLTALTNTVADVVYIDGVSTVGCEVKIYPGWPVPNELDGDIKAGNAHVSIFPRQDERNTTKHAPVWQEASVDVAAGTGTAIKEVGRQERVIQITVWAATPEARKAIAGKVDATLRQTPRLALPDNTMAQMVYRGSPMTDQLQKAWIYRRDLLYAVDYGTTVEQQFHTIKETVINLNK